MNAAKIMHKIQVVMITFLAIATLSSISLAATYYVAQDGSGDFTTIQAAANVAQAGDTVIVNPGNYPEHVVTQADGNSSNYITFRASGEVTVNDFDVTRSYIVIDGFNVHNVLGKLFFFAGFARTE